MLLILNIRVKNSSEAVNKAYSLVRAMNRILNYHTGALLGACAYTSTGKKCSLIREMRLIKSAFFNAGILRTAAKYALNSEYAPNNAPVRYLLQCYLCNCMH